MKRRILSLFSYTAMVYFLSVVFIFFPYYNWQYARQNGFFSWLLLGEMTATTKAFIWPYYIFMANEGISKVNVGKDAPIAVVHIRNSLAYFNSATSLMKSLPQSKSPQKDLEAVMELLRQSRDEAEKIDRAELNSLKPGMGDAVHTDYLAAIRLYNNALQKNGDRNDIHRGDAAMAKFYTYMESQSNR